MPAGGEQISAPPNPAPFAAAGVRGELRGYAPTWQPNRNQNTKEIRRTSVMKCLTSEIRPVQDKTPGYFFVIFCNCKIYIIIYAPRCFHPQLPHLNVWPGVPNANIPGHTRNVNSYGWPLT